VTPGGYRTAVADLLAAIYPETPPGLTDRFVDLAEDYRRRLAGRSFAAPDHGTAYLITYADAFRRDGEQPLVTLRSVLQRYVADAVSHVHLLPIYPWTSDDGFAVVDHRRVNPDLGDWDDVGALAADHPLMFDFVANHVSSSSPWFRGWLAGVPAYKDYFVEPDPALDTSRVVRPRTTPLFSRFARPDGSEVDAWTTFGPDQVDVNAASPDVLLDLTDVLLGYLVRGASAIRLDAIGFLWKRSGTTCLHLPETHAVIKLWRVLVDEVAPGVQLLTETNVPHAENVTYFGDGDDEANLVYQFALPPLVLHSFVVGDTTALSRWAATISAVSRTATWFNFLASHDGIGMRPTEGLLTDDDRARLVERTLAHGGRVSLAHRPDGSETVYELNISYLDALASPQERLDGAVVAAKGLAAHSILLSVVGVPALYYHSFFGSGPDHEGMRESGINRRINREVLDADRLDEELRRVPRRRLMAEGTGHLLRVRRTQPGLSPYAAQQVEALDPRVFAVRRAAGTDDEIVCVTNVSGEHVDLPGLRGTDVVSGRQADGVTLAPFGYAWVRTAV
jgi:glucosylglycerate phosphorylase